MTDRLEHIEKMEAEMLGGQPFTFRAMSMKYFQEPVSRIVDSTIQRFRNKGLIDTTRIKGKPTWQATERAKTHSPFDERRKPRGRR